MKRATENDGVPWFPDCITPFAESAAGARADWGYVVIEEVAGTAAELMRWPWPLTDQLGHLFWPERDSEHLVSAIVPVSTLWKNMYEPSGLERKPRAGDTFAAEIGGSGWSPPDAGYELVTELELLFPGTVVDISADARDAAKLAYQGANAAIYDGSEAEDLLIAAGHTRQQARPALTIRITRSDDAPEGSNASAPRGRRRTEP